MEIFELTNSLCEELKQQIANYIYLSMNRGCAEEWFSRDNSLLKTDQLKQFIEENKAYSFVTVCGGGVKRELCGFLWAYPYGNESVVYLSIIYVDEKHREDGIGRMLIQAMETRVKSDGYTEIWLHTDADNSISRRFYSKMGYKETRVQLSKEI